jgi:hypothetical protein
MGKRDHGLDDLLIRFIERDRTDEAFVDLDLAPGSAWTVRDNSLCRNRRCEIDAEPAQALDARERG